MKKALEIEKEVLSRGLKLQMADNFFSIQNSPKDIRVIAAIVAPRTYTDIDELLDIPVKKGEPSLFVVIDCLEDPRNFWCDFEGCRCWRSAWSGLYNLTGLLVWALKL